jgi:hypothetical protein
MRVPVVVMTSSPTSSFSSSVYWITIVWESIIIRLLTYGRLIVGVFVVPATIKKSNDELFMRFFVERDGILENCAAK